MSREGVELVHRLRGRVGDLCDRWILQHNNIALNFKSISVNSKFEHFTHQLHSQFPV